MKLRSQSLFAVVVGIAGLAFCKISVANTQNSDTTTPAEASLKTELPVVVVEGGNADRALRRDSVAGKITIGRKSIEESGVANVTELLRKEPSITIGPNGKLGLMGSTGFVQILVDGASPSSGKPPLELDLVHVERVEIVKSAVAEFGPYGTAGTINIVSRKIVRSRSLSQLRAGSTGGPSENNVNFSWSRNKRADNTGFSYSTQVSASRQRKREASRVMLADDMPEESAFIRQKTVSESTTDTRRLLVTSTAAWDVSPRKQLTFDPSLIHWTVKSGLDEINSWANEIFGPDRTRQQGESPFTSVSFPLKWQMSFANRDRLTVRLSPTWYRLRSNSQRYDEFGSFQKEERDAARRIDYSARSIKIDYAKNALSNHEIKMGATVVQSNTKAVFDYFYNGEPDRSLGALGTTRRVDDSRLTAYLQDEWSITKAVSANVGVSTEERHLKILEGVYASKTRYFITSPNAHLAWKLGADEKTTLRFSVARTYNTPFVDQLVPRPVINPLAPCSGGVLCGGNTIEFADTAGQPDLEPERSTGLNVAWEKYVGEESIVTFEFFTKRLSSLIATDIQLENVPWASSPRYVSRPRNVGRGRIDGVSLEGQMELSELWKSAPQLNVNLGLTYSHSEISTVPGPDNRLAEQMPWTAKIGSNYRFKKIPLKLSADVNWTPSVWTRSTLSRRILTGRQGDASVQATWTYNPTVRATFGIDHSLLNERHSAEDFFNPVTGLSSRRDTFRRPPMRFTAGIDVKI